jgi:hypothetical protein
MNTEDRLRADDPLLAEKLEELRLLFEADADFPNVLAAWEAIQRLTGANRKLQSKGHAPYPIPSWLNEYLFRAAEKIGRLSVGIPPEDDEPLSPSSRWGELCKDPRDKQSRDRRTGEVASALGFVRGKRASAFQKNDRITRDADYVRMYDDPHLEEDKVLQDGIRSSLIQKIRKNESINSDEAVRNRLSLARTAMRKRRQRP